MRGINILWITNILFPEAQSILHKSAELKGSGGWLVASADALIKSTDYRLIVATVSHEVDSLTKLAGEKIVYYLIPYGKGNKFYNSEYEPYWQQIKEAEQPDIIHIHGTEFSHGAAWVKACGKKNVVVSIQGLIGEIGYHYTDGLSRWDIYNNITIRDVLKGTCYHEQKEWIKRGEYERELIANVDHIIGRTSWDKAHTWAINSSAIYHYCNETLRPEFYEGKWDYDNCIPHSIFMSQAGYPIKGLHILVKALPIISHHYPDTRLRIAGSDVLHYSYKHLTSYSNYIKHLIDRVNLSGIIEFTGMLNAEEIKRQYLKSNVFVCPSSIENSPNSLGEAQILGVPCVASYVGGVMDMMKGNELNLYRFEEADMLAEKICNIFDAKEKQVNMRIEASDRHNPHINSKRLVEIYYKIITDGRCI